MTALPLETGPDVPKGWEPIIRWDADEVAAAKAGTLITKIGYDAVNDRVRIDLPREVNGMVLTRDDAIAMAELLLTNAGSSKQ